jgi:hypothetical protein
MDILELFEVYSHSDHPLERPVKPLNANSIKSYGTTRNACVNKNNLDNERKGN